MTNELELAIKAANRYVEQTAGCRYCENVRKRPSGIIHGGPAFFCTVAGKLGEMSVNPSFTCDRWEERK